MNHPLVVLPECPIYDAAQFFHPYLSLTEKHRASQINVAAVNNEERPYFRVCVAMYRMNT